MYSICGFIVFSRFVCMYYVFYLQYDPVSSFSCSLQCSLSHNLLSLTQGHIMEVPLVCGKTKLQP